MANKFFPFLRIELIRNIKTRNGFVKFRATQSYWRLHGNCHFYTCKAKSKQSWNFRVSSKTQRGSHFWPIWTQKVPKEPLLNVVLQIAKRVCMGNYITSYSLFTQDELCNEVLNTNAKHECLIPLHKKSLVKNEQQVM